MNVEAPKPAPKGALRRLGQRLFPEAPPEAAPKWPPISDERREEILKRLKQEGHPLLNLDFSPLDVITIFINEMINFSYDKADEAAKADKASISNEKINSQTTPEPPPQLSGEPGLSLGKLIKTFNEVMKNLRY